MSGLSSLGLKKTFTWRFGSGSKKKKHEVDPDECERVKTSNIFKFGPASDSEDGSLGSITNILDGVVFTGAENRPPSPDVRRIQRLSSFRGDEDLNIVSPVASADEKVQLPAKERHAVSRQLSHRSGSPALPPIPPARSSDSDRKISNKSTDEPLTPDVAALDNPLYQTISECYSHAKKPPHLAENQSIRLGQERDAGIESEEHYQTVTSDLPVLEKLYARVDGDESEDDLDEKRQNHLNLPNHPTEEPIYSESLESTDSPLSKGDTEESKYQDSNHFYQNLDEIVDSDPLQELSVEICDQKTNFPPKASPHGSSSSSSGHSSLPPSPKLSPNIDSSRRSLNRSPDSGIFSPPGLDTTATLDEALSRFESLEREVEVLAPEPVTLPSVEAKKLVKHLPSLKAPPKGTKKAIYKKKKLKANKRTKSGLLHKMATESVQLAVVIDRESEHEDFYVREAPELPKSPQPVKTLTDELILPLEGVFKADLVEVTFSDPPPILDLSIVSEVDKKEESVLESSILADSSLLVEVSSLDSPLLDISTVTDADTNDESMLESSILSDSSRTPSKRHSNIGELIVEEIVKEQKKKDSKRNEILEVEDIGASYIDLELERLRIIEKQTVKAKRINNWIRSPSGCEIPFVDSSLVEEEEKQKSISGVENNPESKHGNEEEKTTEAPPIVPMAPSPKKPLPPPKNFAIVPTDGDKPYKIVKTLPADETKPAEGEVVSDSILEQKEKTKQYWEAKMLSCEAMQPEPLVVTKPRANFSAVTRTISPPPGFDNEETTEPNDNALNSVTLEPPRGADVLLDLPTDDFVAVGSIIADSEADHQPKKQQYIFGESEDPADLPVSSVTAIVKPKPNPKVVEVVAKRPDLHREPIFSPKPVNSEDEDEDSYNPQESLIEREIRLQKEREEALAREREEALKLLNLGKPKIKEEEERPVEMVLPPVGEDAVIAEEEEEVMASSAEARIAQEIRDLRRREEEVKLMREKLYSNNAPRITALPSSDDNENFASIPTTDEGHYSDAEATTEELGSDGHSSRVASPETPVTYGNSQFPHQRTQSMDSMSSGHSSGDHSTPGVTHLHESTGSAPITKRRVVVKPFEEPEEEENTAYHFRSVKETPIEREIRLAGEREEELRKEKGFLLNHAVKPDKEVVKIGNRTVVNDKRDVQHRLATSRIQQEIEEASQREIELRSTGHIQTTSEERVDAKVARLSQLAEYSAEYELAREKRQRAVSSSHLVKVASPTSPVPPVTTNKVTPVTSHAPPPKAAPLTRAISAHNLHHVPNTTSSSNVSAFRKFSTPASSQKGVMAKFIASRGKINGPPAFASKPFTPFAPKPEAVAKPTKVASPVVSPVVSEQISVSKPEIEERVEKREVAPPRRAFATAEDKIQEELKEMKQREEELRLTRMKMFAKSQPNLLAMMDDEDAAAVVERKVENGNSALRSAVSISNLADSEQFNGPETREPSSREAKSARRKSALIAQWEFRIQQQEN